MSKTLIVFTSAMVFEAVSLALVAHASIGDGGFGSPRSLMSESFLGPLYPSNVECKIFDKTGHRTWQLRDRSTVDLGNWDAAFLITGAIEPRKFVRNGIDLFDVLEIT